jgi:TPR repeat protein
MALVDRLIGLASPTAALRRSIELKEKGQLTQAFNLLAVAAKAGIAEAEHRIARCYFEGSGVPISTRARGLV